MMSHDIVTLGYGLLHSLVFTRLFPTLINLYVLHHDQQDLVYQKGLDFLKEMDDSRLVYYIKFSEWVDGPNSVNCFGNCYLVIQCMIVFFQRLFFAFGPSVHNYCHFFMHYQSYTVCFSFQSCVWKIGGKICRWWYIEGETIEWILQKCHIPCPYDLSIIRRVWMKLQIHSESLSKKHLVATWM